MQQSNRPNKRGPFGFARGRSLAFIAIAVIEGCAFPPWQVVPPHVGRATQIEAYEQTFDFGDVPGCVDAFRACCHRPDPCPANPSCDITLHRIFSEFLGPNNWREILRTYGSGDFRDDLLCGRMRARGQLMFVASPDAADPDYLLVDGGGWFAIYTWKAVPPAACRASSRPPDRPPLRFDFTIERSRQNIDDARRKGILPVKVTVTPSWMPAGRFFPSPGDVRYDIQLLTKGEWIGIAHGKEHPVQIVEGHRFGSLVLCGGDPGAPSGEERSRSLWLFSGGRAFLRRAPEVESNKSDGQAESAPPLGPGAGLPQ